MKTYRKVLFSFWAVFIGITVRAQIESPGIPASFMHYSQKSAYDIRVIDKPNIYLLNQEDSIAAISDLPYRVGVCKAVNISPEKDGIINRYADGSIIWRIYLKAEDAQAIGLGFSNLNLPDEAKLYVYTLDKKYIYGAFTKHNLSKGAFVIRPIPGDECILELNVPSEQLSLTQIEIDEIIYIYRNFEDVSSIHKKSTVSGACEVNISCNEGDAWQNQKRSVVKLLTKVASNVYFCSGSIVNNTAQDFTPYILTAAHCAEGFGGSQASISDYSKWIFYFNYESVSCNSSAVAGQPPTMTGADKMAMSDNPSDMGSDFLLLKLKTNIPAGYQPYYCGWDISGNTSISGACIHHPDGDIKKISTYTSPLVSDTWESTPNTHWKVIWSSTVNGHGVTEGGSSGSPLYNSQGYIVGTLTGGYSACNDVLQPDYYGKFSYSWISNGTKPSQQLKPWLDPANLGISQMPGSFNEKFASADFAAANTIAPIGGYIVFNDLSGGNPNAWHWYFEGGEPAEWEGKTPPNIFYNTYGDFNVKLVVTNEFNTDSIVKKDFVSVRSVVSPNPTPDGFVNILTNSGDSNPIEIRVFDYSGNLHKVYRVESPVASSFTILLPSASNLFFLQVTQGENNHTHKVIRLKR